MAKHTITYRDEMRYGMRQPEVRIICNCGYEDKAQDRQSAKVLVGKHLKGVVNEIKPQKTLDLGDQNG